MSQNPTAVPIQLPLALKPVVRSREGGRPDGSQLPYHPAIVIVDAAGRRVTDVASDPDDIRAGRVIMDPHRLVSRATQVVAWLEEVHGRISGWVEGLDDKASLIVRPVLSVDSSRRRVLAGVQFCSAPDDAFDHLTETLTLLAAGDELEKPLDALRLRTLRRHDAAVTLLAALQDAVHSWRSAEALTSGSGPVLGIDDSRLEP